MKTYRWIALVLLFAVTLTSCASAPATPAAAPAREAPALGASDNFAASSDSVQNSAPAASEKASTGEDPNAAASVNRLVIKDANLTIVVLDPTTSLDAIAKLAESMGGYVVTSNLYKTHTSEGVEVPEANITLRVPAEKLNEALAQIKKQVKNEQTDVLSETVSGQDVTKEYTDLKSRLKNQQAAEEQLREIMASASKPEDVMNIFNQLTQVREQIEVLQGQIRYYEESAALSSISVQIKAEAAVAPLTIGSWQPAGVARSAIQSLIDTLKFLVNAAIWLVIYILPVGIILYGVVRLIWLGLRRLRKPRKNQPGVTPPTPPQPPTV